MLSIAEQQRIDTLLALSRVFGSAPESQESSAESSFEIDLSQFSALNPADRQLIAERAAATTTISDAEQLRLSVYQTEEKQRGLYAQLAEMVHAAHLIEALRAEPRRLRALIAPLLPTSIVNAAFGELNAPVTASLPTENLLLLIRTAFLSQFVLTEQLANPTALDLLTGVEMARLIRLLGVRETAIACRGISSVETVAAFLRRFEAEDAQAIAAHIAALTRIAPERVRFAELTVHQELSSAEFSAGLMLDRIGMSVLALALAARDALTLRFNLQKFPPEGAGVFKQLIADQQASRQLTPAEQKTQRAIPQEIELLATRVRDARASQTSS